MNLGLRFKRYRQRAGLTQNEAAEIIGIKGYQLGNYETNRSEPSISILKGMSKAYGVSVDTLVGNNIPSNGKGPTRDYDVERVIKEFLDYYEKERDK